MDFKKLSSPIGAKNIEFRIKEIRSWDTNVYAILLPYKTARVDMEILDMMCSPENWQNTYHRDSNGVLQCGIGIYDETKLEWIWKFSNGKPSQFEKEKGEYSDAFKRAGFMWGIGRELYSFPKIRVILQDREYIHKGDDNYKITGYFQPNEWTWEINEDYTKVVAKDNGKERFNSNPYKK